ncbi:MAG TPA: hypothetical protein VIY47_14720 [Ignavibacteriaceae bacterium]
MFTWLPVLAPVVVSVLFYFPDESSYKVISFFNIIFGDDGIPIAGTIALTFTF